MNVADDEITGSDRVVVRNPVLVCLVGTLGLGIVAFGLWWAVVAALVGQDWRRAWRDSGVGPTGMVVGWVVAVVLAVLSTYAVAFLLRFRQVFGPRGVQVRRVLVTRQLDVAELTSLELVNGRVWPRRAPVRQVRLIITGRTGRSILDPAMIGARAALPIIAGWVSARPDLGHDDAVRALLNAARP